MTAVQQIQAAQQSQLVDEDGEAIRLEASPPLTPSEIEGVEKRVGARLPAELRSLLEFCSGIEGCLDQIDFTGKLSFEIEEIFPHHGVKRVFAYAKPSKTGFIAKLFGR